MSIAELPMKGGVTLVEGGPVPVPHPIGACGTPSSLAVEAGRPHPLGATPDGEGVNFSLFSRHATAIELLLFDSPDSPQPFRVIELDPARNKTFFFWHVYLRGAAAGLHYAFRVDGPTSEADGAYRFNPNKVLIDPYAKGNTNHLWRRADACGPRDNLATSMRSVVIDTEDYDWEGDRPLCRPMDQLVIYEMHVGGFTRHPTSGVRFPGTFAGVIEKIPYLQELGVTAVELLPVMEFDDTEIVREGRDGEPDLVNFWGYSTTSFFAPHRGYCNRPAEGDHVREFRDMVKALHRAGIAVILDVVFNHTSEGNHLGPTINFRGLANEVYYHLSPQDRRYYRDYSGCGNTVNCNHPVVQKLIVESLEYWVREMHVDGFRFDEGSILSRGEDGEPLATPPVVWSIELSEALADTKIIAEAWDAAGLYQIGYFPGYRWAEWNGRYRDDVRRFVRGEPGLIGAVASRVAGSADIYEASGHLPVNSVNFITCHDGFTLNDLVSYNQKYNQANGESNRDGIDDNASWNCGKEGPSDDAPVEALRARQVKNFATILMVSQGVPMFVAGDEVRRTQGGNNNAWCQDNPTSWFDWSLVDRHADLFRYWKRLIDFRKRHPVLHRSRFFTGRINERGLADVGWHGCRLDSPGWNDPQARALAFSLGGFDDDDLFVMFNMFWEPLDFELPAVPGRRWHVAFDTTRPSPADCAEPGQEEPVTDLTFRLPGRGVAVLVSLPKFAPSFPPEVRLS
jgi:glycogen operon protein